MSTQQEEMLVLIDDQLRTQENEGEPPVVREIARWLVCGYSAHWIYEAENMDGVALQRGFIEDLRDLWPKASDEHIRRGLKLAVTAAKTAAGS